MKFLLPLISLLLLVACSIQKQVAPSQQSSRVEVRTETVFEKDTVYISLPQIEQSRQTLDTVSVLENKYTKSVAIVSDGVLDHSLQVKPVSEPVAIDKMIVYRDSLVYVQLPPEVVEVEKDLNWWQSFKMKIGGWAIGILILVIVVAILYFLFHSKLFKL